MKKNKILIVGGAGLLGVNWAILKREQFDITLGLHKKKITISGVNSVEIENFSIEQVKKIVDRINPDIIINTAGLTNVEQCEAQPELSAFTNVIIPEILAKLAFELGIKFIQISTDHLFNGSNSFYTEDFKTSPLNNYGIDKLNAEKVVINSNSNSLIIRTNFYGWGPSYRKSFSDYIVDNLRNNNPIFLFQDVYYTPIIINKLVETIHSLIDNDAFGVYNVVGDERISKYEFGIQIANHFQLKASLIAPIKFIERNDLVLRPLDMSLSNKKVIDFLKLSSLGSISDHLNLLQKQETLDSTKEIILL